MARNVDRRGTSQHQQRTIELAGRLSSVSGAGGRLEPHACARRRTLGWSRRDGELFDPWLRNWERGGSKFVKAEPESTVIEATVEQWELWTGVAYPVSGEYWLPGGLSTLAIDRENNVGRYCEPHVWFRIPIA